MWCAGHSQLYCPWQGRKLAPHFSTCHNNLQLIIIYSSCGRKHYLITPVEVFDVLGTHETKCPWQGCKLAPALLFDPAPAPTLSSQWWQVCVDKTLATHWFFLAPELHLQPLGQWVRLPVDGALITSNNQPTRHLEEESKDKSMARPGGIS